MWSIHVWITFINDNKRFLKGRWENTGILDCYWSSKHRFSGIPLKCHRGLGGGLGFFWFWCLFLIFPWVTEFREWGGIILRPTCEWVTVSAGHVGWNEASSYFFFRSVITVWRLSFVTRYSPNIYLTSWFSSAKVAVNMHWWYKMAYLPWLEKKLLYTSWRFTEEQLLCWFGGGWMADNNQKQKCHYSFCSPFYQHNNACTVQGFSFSPLLSIHFKPSI